MKSRRYGLVGLLILAIALMVASIPEAQSKTPAAAPAAITCGTDTKPCFIKNIPDEKSPDEIREEKEKDSSDQWLVILTGVLAGVGILQLAVFIFQWRAFISQERTTITAERPHLFWEKFDNLQGLDPVTGRMHNLDELVDKAQNARIVVFDVGLRNCGKSPAFLKAFSIHFQMLKELPEFPNYGDDSKILTYEPAIPPNGVMERRKSLDEKQRISGIDRETILKGEQHLFVWGMVEYTSQFDRGHIYKSRFALKWKAENGRIIALEHAKNKNYWEYT